MLTESYMLPKVLEYATKQKNIKMDAGVVDCKNLVCHVKPFLSEEVINQN